MIAIGVSVATMLATLAGGALAIRLRGQLPVLSAFSGGAMLGVAFFDLIPESIRLAAPVASATHVLMIVVAGFLGFLVMDRTFEDARESPAPRPASGPPGTLGGAILTLHSYLDGFAIGLGFFVSATVGMAVSVAVLAHDFADGINSVAVVLGKSGNPRSARAWLIANSVAPIAGATSTLAFRVDARVLAAMLALCAGFFLFIALGDLLPASLRERSGWPTIVATIVGVTSMYAVTRAFGI